MSPLSRSLKGVSQINAVEPHDELTSTLHLGARGLVGNSPRQGLTELMQSLEEKEREVLQEVIDSNGESVMVFIPRGPNKGSRFLITSQGALIGRSSESVIFLDDVTVSRKHATIEKNIRGTFSLKDLGSLNGTYINGVSATQADLSSGDEIQIGKYHLIFISGKNLKGEK